MPTGKEEVMVGKLVLFLVWLVRESIKSEYNAEMMVGHACKGLIEDIVLIGAVAFAKRVMEGGGTEYRINSADLKLYIDHNSRLNRLKLSIGGEQKEYYPKFVEAVRADIKRRGLDSESYYTATK
jgi:hypothetical protein